MTTFSSQKDGAANAARALVEQLEQRIEREGLSLLMSAPAPIGPEAAPIAYTTVEEIAAIRTFVHGVPVFATFITTHATTAEQRRLLADAHDRVVALILGHVPVPMPRLQAV